MYRYAVNTNILYTCIAGFKGHSQERVTSQAEKTSLGHFELFTSKLPKIIHRSLKYELPKFALQRSMGFLCYCHAKHFFCNKCNIRYGDI